MPRHRLARLRDCLRGRRRPRFQNGQRASVSLAFLPVLLLPAQGIFAPRPASPATTPKPGVVALAPLPAGPLPALTSAPVRVSTPTEQRPAVPKPAQAPEQPTSRLAGRGETADRAELWAMVESVAREEGMDPTLVCAVVQAESAFNPRAKSSVGAMGLMQLMPTTAAELGVENAWDPEQNVRGGTRYLRRMLNQFGEERLALAAYNAGPGTVKRYGGVPPYRETRDYVRKILTHRAELAANR